MHACLHTPKGVRCSAPGNHSSRSGHPYVSNYILLAVPVPVPAAIPLVPTAKANSIPSTGARARAARARAGSHTAKFISSPHIYVLRAFICPHVGVCDLANTFIVRGVGHQRRALRARAGGKKAVTRAGGRGLNPKNGRAVPRAGGRFSPAPGLQRFSPAPGLQRCSPG